MIAHFHALHAYSIFYQRRNINIYIISNVYFHFSLGNCTFCAIASWIDRNVAWFVRHRERCSWEFTPQKLPLKWFFLKSVQWKQINGFLIEFSSRQHISTSKWFTTFSLFHLHLLFSSASTTNSRKNVALLSLYAK